MRELALNDASAGARQRGRLGAGLESAGEPAGAAGQGERERQLRGRGASVGRDRRAHPDDPGV